MSTHSPSGLDALGSLPWGSHVCQFFSTGGDLRDILVPYFKAGLENNERCLLVAMDPFGPEDARSALRAAVGDSDRRERAKQIEIHDVRRWYDNDSVIDGEKIVAGLLQGEQRALRDGFSGLRTNGNIGWVQRGQWAGLQDYEAQVTRGLKGRRMISMCSYCLETCTSQDVLDVVARHSLTLSRTPDGWSVTAAAAAAVRTMEEALDRQSILVRELDHRIKNNLATVQAIAGSTIRSSRSMQEFQQAFAGRIGALSRTHSLLTEREQTQVPLRELLNSQLSIYADGDGERVRLAGPEVVLPPHVAVSFGMAIHELTTNALKYGALSALAGRLAVTWQHHDSRLRLEWRESNVPMLLEPERTGFGMQLLKRLLPVQLGAEVAMHFGTDGLTATIDMPV
jgi:two-component sensor histidine kinase